MKKTVFVLGVFLAVSSAAECYMRLSWDKPPSESEPLEFDYNFKDIFKPFFNKVSLPNETMYVPGRKQNGACTFTANKSPETIRIFLVGGSVAYDWTLVPQESFSFQKFRRLLERIFRDKKIELINCGMSGYDSFRVYLIIKEIIHYEPDLIIFLSGNNEFYPKGSFSLNAYYIHKYLRKLWLCRKAEDFALSWLFDKDIVDKSRRTKEQRLKDYRNNIKKSVKLAKRRSIPVVLCTLPQNMSDYSPPGKSDMPCEETFLKAFLNLYTEEYAQAIKGFEDYLENKEDCLVRHYLGKAYEEKGDYSRAKENYILSLELCGDIWHQSCPSSNEVIRAISREENTGLIDLEKKFISMAPHGITSMRQFRDSCHWWDSYYLIVAKTIIEEMIEAINLEISQYTRAKENEAIFSATQEYLQHLLKEEKEGERAKKDPVLRSADILIHNNIYNESQRLVDEAVSPLMILYYIKPDFFSELDGFKALIKEYATQMYGKEKTDLCFEEFWADLWFHAGEAYRRLGRGQTALICFNKAIGINSAHYSAYIGKTLVFFAQGEKEKAISSLNKAEQFLPEEKKILAEIYTNILFSPRL